MASFTDFLFTKLFQFSNIPGMFAVNSFLGVKPERLNQDEVTTLTPEGVFGSVEAFCCWSISVLWVVVLFASHIFRWAWIGWQMAIRSPAKCLDKRGDSFICRWQHSVQALRRQSSPEPWCPLHLRHYSPPTLLHRGDEALMLVFGAFFLHTEWCVSFQHLNIALMCLQNILPAMVMVRPSEGG